MFQLTLAHLIAAERARDLEADLRRGRILKASDVARRPVTARTTDTVALSAPRTLPATGRAWTAGR